jgi:hypothetical protein
MLRTRFGLELHIQHEILTSNLETFLAESRKDVYPYYTSAFMTLPVDNVNKKNSSRIKASTNNQSYLPEGNHLGFRQTIHPSTLNLSEEQRQRFVKAMRVLALSPYYHLTELASLLSPMNNDASLWEICDYQLKDYPAPARIPQSEKEKKLKPYMKAKNRGQ